jgi:type I restriction enzyme M protein
MLDNETKRRIDTARDILVGKVPDPKSQVEQITIALIYKFMDDMDAEAEELGGKRKFFSGDFEMYGWKKLMAPSLGGFEVLNLYAEAIQKMNINPNIPQLFRDIFKNAFLPYRDPETLKSFLKTIDEFEYDHSERLGDAFEYLLSVLGSQGEAGQFRTPRHIIDFMVDIISPKKDNTILDPACGTAGFLISSYKHILKHNSSNFIPEKDEEAYEQTDVSIAELTTGGTQKYKGDKLTPDERAKLSKNIKGYDISPDMVRLSLVNLYLHGFTDPKISEYDTLTSEDNWNEYADVIMANPPFMSPKGGIKPHKRFSIQSNRSEVLFVDYMVEHLTPNGKAAIIVPEGIIFQSGIAYKQLRKMLVENYLFAVVSLPAGVFNPYSGVKTSILLIDKALNKKTDKILFVKIENDGFDLGAQRRPKTGSQLPISAALVKEYILLCHTERSRSMTDIESTLTDKFGPNNLWNITAKEKIGESGDWNLSGERYKEKTKSLSKFSLLSVEEAIEKVDYTNKILKSDFLTEGKYPIIDQSENFIAGYWNNEGDVFRIKKPVTIFGDHTRCIKFIDFDFVLGADGVKILEPIDKYDPKFFYFLLRSIEVKNLGYSRHFKELKEMKIPLPPLEIQKEIVAEIEGWQKIIDGAKQVVENYKPQIDIDPEWEMVELGTICENYDGKRVPITQSDRKAGSYPYYGASGIVDYVDGYLFDEDLLLVSEDGANLLARVTPIAFSVNGKIWVNNHAHVLKFKNIETQKFVETYLNQIDLSNYITGSAQPKLNQKALNSILIPSPDLEIQKKVVETITLENEAIESNKKLISVFEQKIKDKIGKVWGE